MNKRVDAPRTLAKVVALSSEGPLVDFAVFRAREGDTVTFSSMTVSVCLAAHVLNGILMAQPVATLDGVVRVPTPIIRRRITQ